MRTASVGGTSAEVVATVNSYLPALTGSSLTITVSCLTPAGVACSSFDTGAASGGTAQTADEDRGASVRNGASSRRTC